MGFENDSASDALAQLEERITRAVEIIPRLRQDKEAAELERDAALRQAQQAQSALERLNAEVEGLRQEREQVRVRIERLLGQMDALAAE
jgi:FtsZ-binding cell division protein ZapB